MDLYANRREIYRWLRHCLVGPETDGRSETGETDLRRIQPLERFQTAILFPIVKHDYGLDAVDDEEVDNQYDGDSPAGDAGATIAASGLSKPKRRFVPPSSVGLSLFVDGDAVEIQLIPRAVCYKLTERGPKIHRWRRLVLGQNDSEACDLKAPTRRQAEIWRETVGDDRGELFVLWRPLEDGWLVTLSLSNAKTLPEITDPI